jgi:hypothetical protein
MSDSPSAREVLTEYSGDRVELLRHLTNEMDVNSLLETIKCLQRVTGIDIEWELLEPMTTLNSMTISVSSRSSMELSVHAYKQLSAHTRLACVVANESSLCVCMWRPSWLVDHVAPQPESFGFGQWRHMEFILPECLNKTESAVSQRCINYLCNISSIQSVPELIVDMEMPAESVGAPVLVFSGMRNVNVDVIMCLHKMVTLGISDISLHIKPGCKTVGVKVYLCTRLSEPLSGTKRRACEECDDKSRGVSQGLVGGLGMFSRVFKRKCA